MRQNIALISSVLLVSATAFAGSDKDSENEGPHRFAYEVIAGGRLGVEALQISKEVRQTLGAPEDAGVLVNSVKSDSVASEAGIKPGDIIVEVAGQKVKNVGTIRRALADKDAGQTVPIVVLRDRKSTTLTAKLRERPKHEAFLGDAFDMGGGKGFVFQSGEMHKDLEKLSERLSDLEKRLQSLESRR